MPYMLVYTNDTTSTTTATINNLYDAYHETILRNYLPPVLHQLDDQITEDRSKGDPPSTESYPTSGLDTTNDGNKRVDPPRLSKMKAMEQFLAMTNTLPADAREIQHSQLPHVQLRIRQFTIENAGTGFFMLQGPQPDGTAHAGDQLGTYEGD